MTTEGVIVAISIWIRWNAKLPGESHRVLYQQPHLGHQCCSSFDVHVVFISDSVSQSCCLIGIHAHQLPEDTTLCTAIPVGKHPGCDTVILDKLIFFFLTYLLRFRLRFGVYRKNFGNLPVNSIKPRAALSMLPVIIVILRCFRCMYMSYKDSCIFYCVTTGVLHNMLLSYVIKELI